MCVPLAVPDPDASVTVPVLVVPSPQSHATVCVSAAAASLKGTDRVVALDAATGAAGPVMAPSTGTALVMSIVTTVEEQPPLPSQAFSPTAPWAGPSRPAAEKVTLSAGLAAKVPSFSTSQ